VLSRQFAVLLFLDQHLFPVLAVMRCARVHS
jgi:hypothetical protein